MNDDNPPPNIDTLGLLPQTVDHYIIGGQMRSQLYLDGEQSHALNVNGAEDTVLGRANLIA